MVLANRRLSGRTRDATQGDTQIYMRMVRGDGRASAKDIRRAAGDQ
jgi:hypothetical protein